MGFVCPVLKPEILFTYMYLLLVLNFLPLKFYYSMLKSLVFTTLLLCYTAWIMQGFISELSHTSASLHIHIIVSYIKDVNVYVQSYLYV